MTIIGKYRIEPDANGNDAPIGEGNNARVYKVRHTSTKGLSALKLFKQKLENAEQFKKAVEIARVFGKLRHPSLIWVTDCESHNGHFYAVMNLVEGETLFKHISTNGYLPKNKCLDLMRSLCGAVQFLHNHGVVHNNLSPQNLMLEYGKDYSQALKVISCGSSQIETDSASSIFFTNYNYKNSIWFAPEQMVNKKPNFQTDIYFLGLILFFCITGKNPFESLSKGTVSIENIFSLQTELEANQYPKEIREVVSMATNSNPSARYKTPREFFSALEKAVFNTSSIPKPTSPLPTYPMEEFGMKPKLNQEMELNQVNSSVEQQPIIAEPEKTFFGITKKFVLELGGHIGNISGEILTYLSKSVDKTIGKAKELGFGIVEKGKRSPNYWEIILLGFLLVILLSVIFSVGLTLKFGGVK